MNETASFNTDPDTFDNSSFGATVEDLEGTVVEAAYVTSGRRCTGKMRFNTTQNALIGVLTQKSRAP